MLATGLAERLTLMVFRQPFFVIQILYVRTHQLAEPEVFDVGLFSSVCN